MASNQNGVGLG